MLALEVKLMFSLYNQSLALLSDLYELTMAYAYWKNQMHENWNLKYNSNFATRQRVFFRRDGKTKRSLKPWGFRMSLSVDGVRPMRSMAVKGSSLESVEGGWVRFEL